MTRDQVMGSVLRLLERCGVRELRLIWFFGVGLLSSREEE